MSVEITTDEMFDACFRVATGGTRDPLWTNISALQKAVAAIGVTVPRKLQSAAKEGSKARQEGDPTVIGLANGDRVEATDSFEGLNITLSRGDHRVRLRIVFYKHRFVATIRDVHGDFETLLDVVINFSSSRRELQRALGEKPAKHVRRARPRLTVVCSAEAA